MKKLALIFVSIFVLSVAYVNAANEEGANAESAVMTTSISGTVLDKITGEALVGVKVTVEGLEKSVYTDFDGNFQIEDIRPGSLVLTASYISYKEKTEEVKVDLSKSNTFNVKIESITE